MITTTAAGAGWSAGPGSFYVRGRWVRISALYQAVSVTEDGDLVVSERVAALAVAQAGLAYGDDGFTRYDTHWAITADENGPLVITYAGPDGLVTTITATPAGLVTLPHSEGFSLYDNLDSWSAAHIDHLYDSAGHDTTLQPARQPAAAHP